MIPSSSFVGPQRLVAQFMERVVRAPWGECWEWTGSHTPSGYGVCQFTEGGRRTGISAHRLSYLLHKGPIPSHLELDHLCRNRGCCSPLHLEAVTHAVNMARAVHAAGTDNWQGAKTHCPQGHEYDAENTYHYQGRRGCKTCRAANNQTVNPLAAEWGPVLKATRLELGMTQREMADRLGVSSGLVCRVEIGKYPLTAQRLESLLAALPQLAEQVAA